MTLTEHIQPLLDKRLPAALVGLLLSTTSALAVDHLVPPEGIAEYQEQLAKTFKDVYADDIQVRSVVEPSFEKEFAVGTRLSSGSYSILYLQAKDSIWYSMMNKKPGPLLKEGAVPVVGVEKCQHQIPDLLGARLSSIWELMLKAARPDESGGGGLDGVSYYFSKEVEGKSDIAMAWSPEEASKPGALVGIVETMKQLCVSPRKTLLDQLDRQSKGLLARLAPELAK